MPSKGEKKLIPLADSDQASLDADWTRIRLCRRKEGEVDYEKRTFNDDMDKNGTL